MANDAHRECRTFCPYYHRAAELIGRRWTGAILLALLHDVERFSDLRATIPEISDRLLSQRLKELELEGIARREVIPETPVRIAYCLTPKGRALGATVEAMAAWAHEWMDPGTEPAACPGPGAQGP